MYILPQLKKGTSKPSRDSRCVTKFHVVSNKLRIIWVKVRFEATGILSIDF